MKHLLLSLFITLLSVAASPLGICAQNSEIGTWNVHSVFATPPVKVIDTGSKVYYVSGGSLFSYDKNQKESYSYTSGNKLSDVGVTNIFYNSDKKYLVIAYENGNLDMLYDDGDLYNLSDIVDSSIEPPLTINDVAFGSDRFYVATEFGLVEFSDERHEVVQSGNYSTPVGAVTVMDGRVLIWADRKLRHIAVGERFHSLSRFTEICDFDIRVNQFVPISDNAVIARLSDTYNFLSRQEFDFENNRRVAGYPVASHTPTGYVTRAADGTFYFTADGALYKLNADFSGETQICMLPEEFSGCVVGLQEGPAEVWSLTREGIACHDLSNTDEGVTVISERYRPEEFSVRDIAYLKPSVHGHAMLAFNIGSGAYRNDRPGPAGYNVAFNGARIDLNTGRSVDLSPYPVDAHMPNAIARQEQYGKFIFCPTGMVEDPDDPDVFYVGTMVDGVYKIRNGELEGIYSCDNSPIRKSDSRSIVYGVGIDRGGNLWVSTSSSVANAKPLFMLPAAKRRMKPDETTADDWIYPDTKSVDYAGGQDIQMLFCKKSNVVFISDHNQSNYFFVYDTRGTFDDFSDDRMRLCTRLVDQDGNVFNPTYCSAFCEDANGAVWIGTDQGIIVISNPQNALNDNMVVRRVKVPKNDGTNTAEYLLGTDLVFSIAIDAGNRKWMATKQSGLFLVSPDGSEILKNFTSDNSPLPSNNISSVYADPSGSTIYVGTSEGLFSYSSDATPAEDDFSKIVVFPNPVTPDYSGPIYVKGLMDNSLVKIADASGQVLYQGRSEGGMFSWDGCNSVGVRVPSGVYYVFASQNGGDSSSGGTAKFMIIK